MSHVFDGDHCHPWFDVWHSAFTFVDRAKAWRCLISSFLQIQREQRKCAGEDSYVRLYVCMFGEGAETPTARSGRRSESRLLVPSHDGHNATGRHPLQLSPM